ncbi:MAG: hypothetical protein IJD10_02310, partial [Clostridia bacterium]|nr:hypothetical protein [Clostridia bacterium]
GKPMNTLTPAYVGSVHPTIDGVGNMSVPGMKLYRVLTDCFADEVEARWIELRAGVLSNDNIKKTFKAFTDQIPEIAYTTDALKWKKVPYPDVNRTNIISEAERQLALLDAFYLNFNVMEEEPDETTGETEEPAPDEPVEVG